MVWPAKCIECNVVLDRIVLLRFAVLNALFYRSDFVP